MLARFEHLTLHTQPKRFELGRRLYTFHLDQQQYWLKVQLLNSDLITSASFVNELSFYRGAGIAASFILPAKVIEIEKIHFESIYPHVLVLPNADSFLKEQVSCLSLSQIKHRIEKMLDVLALLHQTGYMHGDLKPEHFLSYQQQLCLIDFEQAQNIHLLQDHALNATPRYMAPELFHGESKSIQSDLYALGIILYEWLSEQRLSCQTYQQWAELHCQRFRIQPHPVVNMFLPLLNGLLQKHKLSRFSNAEEAKDMLLQIKC